MAEKISLTFIREGKRFAVDRIIDRSDIKLFNLPLLEIKTDFSSITMPRYMLGDMLRQLDMAEIAEAEIGYGILGGSDGKA